MANGIASPIYLKSAESYGGIGQSIGDILSLMGKFEQVRRERGFLDNVSNAIMSGATPEEAITKSIETGTEYNQGIQGIFQRIGGVFQPQPNRLRQDTQNLFLNAQLRKAIYGKDITEKLRKTRDIDIKTLRKEDATDTQRTEARTRLMNNPQQPKNKMPANTDFEQFLESSEKEGMKWGKKSFEGAVQRVYDNALTSEYNPNEAITAFRKWWDDKVKGQRTGLGKIKPNTFVPRNEFEKDIMGNVKKPKVLTKQIRDEILMEIVSSYPNITTEEAKKKGRELAKKRGYQF
jgi:hypothetical protein